MSQLNLNNPPADHHVSISMGRSETAGERRVRLFKDVIVFSLAALFVSLIVWQCYATVGAAEASAEDKKWAMSILTAITSGLVGYLIKK